MLPNSLFFLVFVAIAAAAYYVLPARWRWLLLLVASYYFSSTYDWKYLLLLASMTLVAYLFGRALGRRPHRGLLFVAILIELAVLIGFKYLNFLAQALDELLAIAHVPISEPVLPPLQLTLPAGLSFFTFSCISYLVDVHRRTTPEEAHLGKLAVYIALFPKLLAGPIARAGS